MNTKVYPGMIDSHFHSQEMKKRGFTPSRILKSLLELGMDYLLDVGISPEDFLQRRKFAQKSPRILMSEGIHPGVIASTPPEHWSLLEKNLEDPKVIALGEIGLDWYRGRGQEKEQKEAFRRQISMANSSGKPIIIHNRDADNEILEILDDQPVHRTGIFHCFSSDWNFAKRCLDRGYYLSFAGNVTYKKSTDIQEVAKKVPWNRILFETDSPYLAPQTVRGKNNHPGFLGHTIDFIAGLRRESPVELSLMAQENFYRLFNLARR